MRMTKATLIFISFLVFITNSMTHAWADWRKDVGIFRIGVVTKQDAAKTILDYEPFKNAISRALQMDVEIFPARSETNLIQALAADRIEYAILSTSGYALSWVLCECVEPLVTARTNSNGDAYHTVLITPVTGLSKTTELTDAKIGVLSEQSISGHPFAKFLLAQENISIDTPQKPFISHDNGEETLKAFQNGELDALIGWSSMIGDPTTGFSSGTLTQLGNLNNGDAKPYRIIWNSPALPYRPHVIAKNLSGEAKAILRATMEALFDRSPVAYDVVEQKYGGGFVISRHSRFGPLIEFVKSLYKPEPEKIILPKKVAEQ